MAKVRPSDYLEGSISQPLAGSTLELASCHVLLVDILEHGTTRLKFKVGAHVLYRMGEVEDVIEDARSVGFKILDVINTEGATGDDLRQTAVGFDDIEAKIEKLLADG